MIIKLSPQRRDDTLQAVKRGKTLVLNGEEFDFSRMAAGDTLPAEAISSEWFAGPVDHVDGELSLTLFLPLPWNFSPEQLFPVPLVNVLDGSVEFPKPLPDPEPETEEPQA